MKLEKNLFVGILANVDNSILKVKLGDNFEIKRSSKENAIDVVHNILKLPLHFIDRELTSLNCSFENNVYYITKTDYDPYDSQESLNEQWYGLFDTVDLIRLFKKGNIRAPFCYQIRRNPITATVHKLDKMVYSELFHLEDEEVPQLTNFIKNLDFPFNGESLQLAFNNLNVSYEVENLNLQFLSLMNGVEALLSPSDGRELNNRISRNLAVLLGESVEDCEDKFKNMKDMYGKRSKIVHSGNESISKDDLNRLRQYLRISILEIYKIMNKKDELFENGKIKLKRIKNIDNLKDKILYMLNATGFGERTWIN